MTLEEVKAQHLEECPYKPVVTKEEVARIWRDSADEDEKRHKQEIKMKRKNERILKLCGCKYVKEVYVKEV